MNSDDFVLTEAEAKMLDDAARYDALKHATEDGIIQGKKENQIEIAKNMLKEKMDIHLISKLTKLPEEEIKNIL